VRARLGDNGANIRQNPAFLKPSRANPNLFRPPPGIRALRAAPSDADAIVLAGDIANGAAGIDWQEKHSATPCSISPATTSTTRASSKRCRRPWERRRARLASSCSIAAKSSSTAFVFSLHPVDRLLARAAGERSAVVEAARSSIRIIN